MTQIQHWQSCDRVLVTDEEHHGSVQVDIFSDKATRERFHADALIWSLWVDEFHRRQGVARGLLEAAEKAARGQGCKSVCLEWDARESKEWTLQWYRRQGYDEREFTPGRSSLLVKELKV